jgi:AcrR family transcriptional regulator
VNQKARTRAAIVQAARELARSGAEITMPSVAKAALVSEATAYRYFPDLVTLLLEVDEGTWPDPEEALAPLARSITRPADAARRPGHRFGLINAALAPAADRIDPAGLAQLRRDLAVVVSADALFTLTDLCGLSRPDAVGSAVHTARALTEAAFRTAGRGSRQPAHAAQ